MNQPKRRPRLAACLLIAAAAAGLPALTHGEPTTRSAADLSSSWFAAPFQTDAELHGYRGDLAATVRFSRPVHVFGLEGIGDVSVDGRTLPVVGRGTNWVAVQTPEGTHDVTVSRDGEPVVDEDAAYAGDDSDTFVDDLADLAEAIKKGGTIVIGNGVYDDVRVTLDSGGQLTVVRPESPGGVTFRGETALVITGSNLTLKGFRFEGCGTDGDKVVQFIDADDCRITQCQFFDCGNPTSTFTHIVSINLGCDRNRVDHNYFTGSRSMSVGQIVQDSNVGKNNRIDHNVFRDISRYWINGQEPVQLGQSTTDQRPEAVVEFNVFDHAWADAEIISNKSSGNIIRHNVAAHSPGASYTLRGGFDVTFDGNVSVNCADGIRVLGKRHVITNNLIVDANWRAIRIENGDDTAGRQQAKDCLIAHNTILNTREQQGGSAVYLEEGKGKDGFAPSGNTLAYNVVVTHGQTALEGVTDENTLNGNHLDQSGEAAPFEMVNGLPMLVEGSVLIDAATDSEMKTDLLGRERDVPDVGAEEYRPQDERMRQLAALVPAERRHDFGSLLGAVVEGDTLPADGGVVLKFLPTSFAETAEVKLVTAEGEGLALTWGGAAENGTPIGLFELYRLAGDERELVHVAVDPMYPQQEYRKAKWRGGEVPESLAPAADKPYEIAIVRVGGAVRVWVTHNDPDVGSVPILTWRDLPAGEATIERCVTGAATLEVSAVHALKD